MSSQRTPPSPRTRGLLPFLCLLCLLCHLTFHPFQVYGMYVYTIYIHIVVLIYLYWGCSFGGWGFVLVVCVYVGVGGVVLCRCVCVCVWPVDLLTLLSFWNQVVTEEVHLDKETGLGAPPVNQFVVRTNQLSQLPVREGLEHYGGDAYFNFETW